MKQFKKEHKNEIHDQVCSWNLALWGCNNLLRTLVGFRIMHQFSVNKDEAKKQLVQLYDAARQHQLSF